MDDKEKYSNRVKMINKLRERLKLNPEDRALKKKIEELEGNLFSEEINRDNINHAKFMESYGLDISNFEEE